MASRLKLLQEQKDSISRQIIEARNDARPEIETAIAEFFQKLKEDFSLYQVEGEAHIVFAENDDDYDFGVEINTDIE